jgi:polyhydroxybutyrate depolymerase
MSKKQKFPPFALALLSLVLLLSACSRSYSASAPAVSGVSAASAAPATPPASGTAACPTGAADDQIISGGQTRTYRLYVPRSYQPGTPAPLLLGFHGAGSSGAQFESYSGFDTLSERFGFIAIYPQGLGDLSNWDTMPNSTDVPFVRDLIADLESRCYIDPARVYATGHSRGGGMVNRLGCELSDWVAAIAPVSGDYEFSETCTPTRPVPVMAFHGTADPVLPYNGFGMPGQVHETYTRIGVPVPTWAAGWAGRNGCSSTPAMVFQFGPVTGQGWGSCKAGADVLLYTIQDGTHDWPSAVDAAQLIWDFFSRHPLPAR